MKNQHTQHPWIIDVSDRVLDANDNKAAIVGSNGESICFIEKTLGMEEVANAKLIAAAPDLLEALKETQILLHTYQKETPVGEKFKRITGRLKSNLEAIKKATL